VEETRGSTGDDIDEIRPEAETDGDFVSDKRPVMPNLGRPRRTPAPWRCSMVVAATDCVDRPEAVVADPVWRKRGGFDGLRLTDLLREPWERWQRETAERAAAIDEAEARHGTFETVQAILAERGESQALKRAHPSDYMLSGVLRCGRCRKSYVGTAAHGRKSRYRYHICSTRYRYGTNVCDGDRLPMQALEDAVVEQMAEVFADTALVGQALALSRAEEAGAFEESAQRLASMQQQLAGARRSLDRYFGAFEQGIMSAADCQERIERLRDRIEALEAEERTIAEGGSDGSSIAPSADDVAEWAQDIRLLFEKATPQQKKALIRFLVKELRVMSRMQILPTYEIPALVRAPEGQVDLAGRCVNRLPLLQALRNQAAVEEYGSVEPDMTEALPAFSRALRRAVRKITVSPRFSGPWCQRSTQRRERDGHRAESEDAVLRAQRSGRRSAAPSRTLRRLVPWLH
jgi:exonuclease VII small subunit